MFTSRLVQTATTNQQHTVTLWKLKTKVKYRWVISYMVLNIC